ncbi:MAG: hypothetical protein IPN56_06660 [Chitinophagaceae bacterium]|nr:hypothetical protein [Chitinophagaceae bacterium]
MSKKHFVIVDEGDAVAVNNAIIKREMLKESFSTAMERIISLSLFSSCAAPGLGLLLPGP